MFSIKEVKKSIFKKTLFLLLFLLFCVSSCGIIGPPQKIQLGEIRYDGTMHEGEYYMLETIKLSLLAAGPDGVKEIIADSLLLNSLIPYLLPTILPNNLTELTYFCLRGSRADSMINAIYVKSVAFLDKNRDKISNCRILKTVLLEKRNAYASISLCQDANRNISLLIVGNLYKEPIYRHLPTADDRKYKLSENVLNISRRRYYAKQSEATIEIFEKDALYKAFLLKLDKRGNLLTQPLHSSKDYKPQQIPITPNNFYHSVVIGMR